ncbi:MAG: molybdate ABC transporter permease subunit [Anaerolineales bacterium]|nr:MAG: molybdate ABC transporter permease subunit [Anaerolineales bacterium]
MSSILIPLSLSLRVAVCATLLALLLGIPIAAALARRTHFFANLMDAVANLPLVLPPTVLGYYLLVLFGSRSPLGSALDAVGIRLTFTWYGAVIAASLVALPLVVQSARSALEAVDPDLEDVARTLGRSNPSIFFSISLPLAWRGVLAGTVLAFSRALGEFGATLLVAGNIPGSTQTMPIAIYDAVQSGNQNLANSMALIITITAITLLILIRYLSQEARRT